MLEIVCTAHASAMPRLVRPISGGVAGRLANLIFSKRKTVVLVLLVRQRTKPARIVFGLRSNALSRVGSL